MTRTLLRGALAAALALVAPALATAAGLDREESELPMALRPSSLAVWERWLETRQYRLGVPVDCTGPGCGGSAESPTGSPSRDRQGQDDRRGKGERDSVP
jgi:hypothetical protein